NISHRMPTSNDCEESCQSKYL
ncbi:unnamed protein product, partial [Allacma fusca]